MSFYSDLMVSSTTLRKHLHKRKNPTSLPTTTTPERKG